MPRMYIAQAKFEHKGVDETGNSIWSWTIDQSAEKNIFSQLRGQDENSNHVIGCSGCKIYQFGIQTLPGFKFVVNSQSVSSGKDNILNDQVGSISVGQTGIFEINLMTTGMPISTIDLTSGINFLKGSTESLKARKDNEEEIEFVPCSNSYALIDVIYQLDDSSIIEEGAENV